MPKTSSGKIQRHACRDGYLVRPKVKQFPLKVDMRGIRMKGRDLDAHEVAERLTPFLVEIAKRVAEEARDRKTIIWLPSVDSAQRLSEALAKFGLQSNFVSGACPDRAEKIAAFRGAGVVAVAGFPQDTSATDPRSAIARAKRLNITPSPLAL